MPPLGPGPDGLGSAASGHFQGPVVVCADAPYRRDVPLWQMRVAQEIAALRFIDSQCQRLDSRMVHQNVPHDSSIWAALLHLNNPALLSPA
jgi:hypothetical protein